VSRLAYLLHSLLLLQRLQQAGYEAVVSKEVMTLDSAYARFSSMPVAEPIPGCSLVDHCRWHWRKWRVNWHHLSPMAILRPRSGHQDSYMIGNPNNLAVKEYCRAENLSPLALQAGQFIRLSPHPEAERRRDATREYAAQWRRRIIARRPEISTVIDPDFDVNLSRSLDLSMRAYFHACDLVAKWPDRPLLVDNIYGLRHRLLCAAWRQHSRPVIGFSHGNSFALAYKPGIFRRGDLLLLDEYVTPSMGEAELVRHGVRDFSLGFSNDCLVRSCGQSIYRRFRAPGRHVNRVTKVRAVMIIGFPISGDYRASYHPEQHTLAHIHLEMQLMALLKKNGYEVIYKAHPDTLVEARGLFEHLADQILTGPFEKASDVADCLLFGTPATTVFGRALLEGWPMVCLDTEGNYWHPAVHQALQRRCAMVPATTDGAGRIVFRDEDVLAAVAAAPRLTDATVVNEFALREEAPPRPEDGKGA
jgi:hypothetical protein